MTINGTLVNSGEHISFKDFLSYLSDMIPEVNIYTRETFLDKDNAETVEWLFMLHDGEYLSSKPYLIGQAFWLTFRKFLNPIYSADPQSTAEIIIGIKLPSGKLRSITHKD